jgi:ribonuclease VapC
MVIDTSAVLAILQNEPERDAFIKAVAESPVRLISAASYVEAGIVMETRYGAGGVHQVMLFLSRADVRVEPVDRDQAEIALDAYRRFGRGRHRAALNYGDCFSYALTAVKGGPLLYKGTDFTLTDL